MSIINDKFLVDIIKEYQTPTKDQFINFLSKLSKQEAVQLIYENKCEIFHCDSCGKDNISKRCNSCQIIRCTNGPCIGVYFHKCYSCKLTYCEECTDYINIGRNTYRAFCEKCSSDRTNDRTKEN